MSARERTVVEFNADVLEIDAAAEAARIEAFIRDSVGPQLRRKGAVVAVSGGIDSAVCVTLAARALGSDRVLGLLLPETDSASKSTALGKRICEELKVPYLIENIAPALEALGCYRRRDDAIRTLFPDYEPDWKNKITVGGSVLQNDRINYFDLTVQAPGGELQTRRMPPEAYQAVVAATNMKQRTRKLIEYHHAERLRYADVGTPNLLEYELGFFVRGGDGLADIKPISHLYKTQVYAIARAIGVPDEVCSQLPSTDTYSLPQTQEEFYFALPYDLMDLMLYAYRHDVAPAVAGPVIGLTADQAQRVYRDIAAKIRVAGQLHQHALVVADR